MLPVLDGLDVPVSPRSGSQVRRYSDEAKVYTEVAPVFDRIKTVSSNKVVVKKINAVYVFDIEGEGKWHVDLKNGEGDVGPGEPVSKADVTVSMNKAVFLQIFNREVKPATAFMNGQMQLSGDLSKALALESIMKANRGD